MERSQKEVARELGISQAQVSRLERSALRKLRALHRSEEIRDYLLPESVESPSGLYFLRKVGALPHDTSFLTLFNI